MDFLKIVKERRSVRDYRKDIPHRQDIKRILDAGRWAPSGLNNQPWRFMVISDGERKAGLAALTTCGGIVKKAPVVIAVFFDLKASYHREKDFMAIGACIQNMLLQAHASGLGTCWLGEILNRKKEAQGYLKVKKDLELAALVAVGYSKKRLAKGRRRGMKKILITG